MLRIVPHAAPPVGRSHEHFLDGFERHLLYLSALATAAFIVASLDLRVSLGARNLRITALQNCAVDPRRARI